MHFNLNHHRMSWGMGGREDMADSRSLLLLLSLDAQLMFSLVGVSSSLGDGIAQSSTVDYPFPTTIINS